MTATQSTPIWQVDAFTARPFAGNPAGVCWLESPRPDDWMQKVGAEMNLAETAIVQPGQGGAFGLRWFTPTLEVPLCGHATLASAHVLWESGLLAKSETARFMTRSGLLTAKRVGERIELDFPAIEVQPAVAPDTLLRALPTRPRFCGRTPDRGKGDWEYLVELEDERAVRGFTPDFASLVRDLPGALIITARADRGGEHDVVSRYFAPRWGINEDPVTGVAHCSIVPYWCRRLERAEIEAYQASSRGGVIHARLGDGRVCLGGEAVTVIRGELLA